MKNLKKYISILLTLQLMLVSMLIPGVTATAPVGMSESSEELSPMMAQGCGDLQSWYNITHETKAEILRDVEGDYQSIVGKNPNIYYNSNGEIYLCGTGSYSGTTYATGLQRSWYL